MTNLCSEFSFFLFIRGYGRNTLWRQVRSHGFRKRACKGSAWDQFIGEVTRTETNSFLKDYWDTSYVYKCTLPSPKKNRRRGGEEAAVHRICETKPSLFLTITIFSIVSLCTFTPPLFFVWVFGFFLSACAAIQTRVWMAEGIFF